MVVSFVETMRGTVRGDEGRSYPCDFNIKAEASSLRKLLKTGMTQISGLVHAEPWVAEAPARGTLTMSLLPPRISYSVGFQSKEGKELVIEGAKEVQASALLYSMTHLPVTVREKSGAVLGTGELTFDLKELVPFLASWLPFPRHAQRMLDMERRAVERRALAGA
jgi:hypothetical protein